MKKFILFLVLPLLLCCSKDDDSSASLPPATQTGAGTFGCKVNGKNFVHNDGLINCYYQYVDGGFYFSIAGVESDKSIRSIRIGTEEKSISEGEILPLNATISGNAYGGVFFVQSNTQTETSYTDSEYTGQMTITKFDLQNRIVSGTFWFDLKHPYTGEKVEIREGRFDSHF